MPLYAWAFTIFGVDLDWQKNKSMHWQIHHIHFRLSRCYPKLTQSCNLACLTKASLSPCHCVLQELCSALEVKEELYQELMNKGSQLLAMTPEGPDSNTEQDLANLKDKWEAVQGKVAERKVWS